MVARFVSKPLEIPVGEPGPDLARADLVFYGIDHSGASFEGRVFINAPKANIDTPRDDPHYAGSFHIFGHGGCFGDAGHCDVRTAPADVFDLRPPDQLLPATRAVIVTDALIRLVLAEDETLTVTVVAVVPGAKKHDVLKFETVRLLTYH
jgi:hypothetical protein